MAKQRRERVTPHQSIQRVTGEFGGEGVDRPVGNDYM